MTPEPFVYGATVLRVIDGDTFAADVDVGFGLWLRDQRIRLLGVDTDELRDRDPARRETARKARDWLTARLPAGSRVTVRTCKPDHFGRLLATAWAADGAEVGGELVAAGLASRKSGETN